MCKKEVQTHVVLAQGKNTEVANFILGLLAKDKCGEWYYNWQFWIDDSKIDDGKLYIMGDQVNKDHWMKVILTQKKVGLQISFWTCDGGQANQLLDCVYKELTSG